MCRLIASSSHLFCCALFVVLAGTQVSILQQPAFCVVRSLIAFRLTSTHKDYCVVGTDAGKVTILEYLPETSEVSNDCSYEYIPGYHTIRTTRTVVTATSKGEPGLAHRAVCALEDMVANNSSVGVFFNVGSELYHELTPLCMLDDICVSSLQRQCRMRCAI